MGQVERIRPLQSNAMLLDKKYIAYWCHLSLRGSQNHALEYAIHLANKHTLPLITFTTTDNTLPVHARNILFEMESKAALASALEKKEIACCHLIGSIPALLSFMLQDSAALVMDEFYLKEQKEIEHSIVTYSQCPIIAIESNVVVPVQTVSQKSEYGAYTLRPKIHKLLDKFLLSIDEHAIETPSVTFAKKIFFPTSYHEPRRYMFQKKQQHVWIASTDKLCNKDFLYQHFTINGNIDNITSHEQYIHGGEPAAHHTLHHFLEHHFTEYAKLSRDPSTNQGLGITSGLSPFLRLGIISPIQIIHKMNEYMRVAHTKDSLHHNEAEESYHNFFEELVVRRELAYNFTYYHIHYDQYKGLPEWSRNTLDAHKEDHRPVIYTKQDMEQGNTQDPYWNAAQNQLLKTGAMHGYMRMYWGKKILEWMEDPKLAFEFALYLNNAYALDAPDPSSYAGIAWCFGTHDRPHPQRAIFGTVRYMNANGLRRKFDIDVYANRWNSNSS